MIRLSPVQIGPEEEELVLAVLRSGRLAQGPMVERFEDSFRVLVGVGEAVAVSSGTAALVLCFEALGIGPGDEVITSPLTFAASINAVLEAGAKVRFADIGRDFTIDPAALEAAVTPQTAAIMPVHLYGQPADLPAIARIAARHGLAIVEDAAQAHGASVDGTPVGAFGLGCFSFYATKNLTTGEGGMITTNDVDIADRLRLLRSQGMSEPYAYELPGHNFRLTEMQAAIGLPQVARLEETNAVRKANAAFLSKRLDGLPGIAVPVEMPGRLHVYHQYTIRISGMDRDAFGSALHRRGVETRVYYPRVAFDYACYREHPQVITGAMPEAERAAREVLSLPIHPLLTDGDLEHIADSVRDVARNGLGRVPG